MVREHCRADTVAERVRVVYLAGIKRCFRHVLQTQPSARGELVVTFVVSDQGNATSLVATSFDGKLEACVERMALGWRFPVPRVDDVPAATSFELAFALSP